MTQESQLKKQMATLLARHGVIVGTEQIAIALTTVNCKRCIVQQARALEVEGVLTIQHGGGRGRKTVYKRNPNQPGQPRRRRGAKR